jgi:hypothetical protein
MKNYKWILIVFLLTAGTILLFGTNLKEMKYLAQQEENSNPAARKFTAAVPEQNGSMSKDHAKQAIDCKTCHYCEYPTINDPCLFNCPRSEMVSIHHSADEGPEIVEMDMIKGDYGVVIFSHKLHAEMSEMSGGCESCHHYNTTGPVLKCITCHEPNRIREDLSKPDLEAAYHRQCLSCHRQWSRETTCQACHINQNSPDIAKTIQRIKESKHEPVHSPQKIVYETEYEKGKLVTFFHEQHTKTFNLACKNCHQDDNCMKCHDVNLKKLHSEQNDNQRKKVHYSFEDHHKACITCHEKDDCGKCHKSREMEQFEHFRSTGFDLNPRHSMLKCTACHKQQGTYKGLSKNCTSCHSNFAQGKFDHRRIGLELDDIHTDMECGDCHKGNNFGAIPKCNDCHDDKYHPHSLPGKRISIQKSATQTKKK